MALYTYCSEQLSNLEMRYAFAYSNLLWASFVFYRLLQYTVVLFRYMGIDVFPVLSFEILAL